MTTTPAAPNVNFERGARPPFQGIFPEPAGPPVLDIAALLAIV